MDNIKRVLVAVDLTEMDEKLVGYVAKLSNTIALDRVYFFNVLKSLELPKSITKKYPNLIAPLDETTKKEIQFTIDEVAGNQLNVEYEIDVAEGSRVEQILKWAKIKEIDLIVLGRKSTLKGDGIVSTKIVRLAPCSVALVPEQLPESVEKVLVPIDYSKPSNLALEFAINLRQTSTQPKAGIVCLNVYNVPSGYSTSGKTYEEFAEIMKKNAMDSFQELIKSYALKEVTIDAKFELEDDDHVANIIYKIAVQEKVSAIIIGSRGRTQAASFILSSTAEKLLRRDSSITLIVVKQRRHNLSFLEALLKI